jgi:hypothetical protein
MQAKQELTRLRDKLNAQIAALQSEMVIVDRTIQLLEREDQSSPTAPQQGKRFRSVGLSDAIRQIVAAEWISPTEVRDGLMHGGYPNKDKGKLLGAVFTTMKRLGESIFEGKRIDGKLKYRMRQKASAIAQDVAPQQVNGSGSLRKMQIHAWLKENGPSTRKGIVDGTGIPDGTVGAYLSRAPDLFEKRDGHWTAHQ